MAKTTSGGTLSISWGRYGGFYASFYRKTKLSDRRYWRVCAGWAALTFVPIEIDDLMEAYAAAVPSREDMD